MVQEQIDTKKILEELNLLRKEIENIKIVIAENLEFSRRIDKAWEEYDWGKFVEIDRRDLPKELKKW